MIHQASSTAIVGSSWDVGRDLSNLLATRRWLQRQHPTLPLIKSDYLSYFWEATETPDIDRDLRHLYGAPADFLLDEGTYDVVVLLRAQPLDPELLFQPHHVQAATDEFMRAFWRLRLVRTQADVIACATCGDAIDHAYLGDLPGYSHTTFQEGDSDVIDLYVRDGIRLGALPSFRDALQKCRQGQVEASREPQHRR